jgi:hypothetical protein
MILDQATVTYDASIAGNLAENADQSMRGKD